MTRSCRLPALGFACALAALARPALAQPVPARRPARASTSTPPPTPPCPGSVAAPIDGLIRSGREQYLGVRFAADCTHLSPPDGPFDLTAPFVLRTRNQDGRIALTVRVLEAQSRSIRLQVDDTVPEATLATAVWELVRLQPGGETVLATVRLRGYAGPTFRDLRVHYRENSLARGDSHAATVDGERYAVIDPTVPGSATTIRGHEIVNVARLAIEPRIGTWSHIRAADAVLVGRADQAGHLVWCAQSTGEAAFPVYGDGTHAPMGTAVPINTNGAVRYVLGANGGADRDLHVRTLLVYAPGGAYPAMTRARAACESFADVLAHGPTITLAHHRRRESVPLPIVDHLRVRCGPTGRARAERVATPSDEDLGRCRLVYERPNDANDAVLRAHGPQLVRVEIIGADGAVLATRMWRFEPWRPRSAHGLLLTQHAGSSSFRIRARLDVTEPLVTYREGSSTTASASAPAPEDGYSFEADVRARGLFAPCLFGGCWDARVFLTFPVAPVSLRFPARARNLTSSIETDAVELMGPRVGALVAVEPWDYANRRNGLYPLPVRFLVGGYLLEVGQEDFAPTFDVGVSLSLPLVDSPSQLGTSLSITALAEYDSGSGTWGVVLSFSADILSLFSPEPKD